MLHEGLGRERIPPSVAAYLRKVASMPTEELRRFAHRWHGEPLGRYAEAILARRGKAGGAPRRAGGGSVADPFGYLGALNVLPMRGPQLDPGAAFFWSHPQFGTTMFGPFPSEESLLEHFAEKAREAGLYRRGGSVKPVIHRVPHRDAGGAVASAPMVPMLAANPCIRSQLSYLQSLSPDRRPLSGYLPRYDAGGSIPLSEGSPWWARAEERQAGSSTSSGQSGVTPPNILGGLAGLDQSMLGPAVFRLLLSKMPYGVAEPNHDTSGNRYAKMPEPPTVDSLSPTASNWGLGDLGAGLRLLSSLNSSA